MNLDEIKIIDTPEEVKQEFTKSMQEYLLEYAVGFESVVKSKVVSGKSVPLMYFFLDLKGNEVTDPVSVESAYAWHKAKGIQITPEGIESMIHTGVKYTVEENRDKVQIVSFCMTMPTEEEGTFMYILGLRSKDTTAFKATKYRVRKSKKSGKDIVRFHHKSSQKSLYYGQGFEELGYELHLEVPAELVQ